MARVTAPALVTRRQYMKDTAHKHHRRALHPLILITGLHILNHASKIYFLDHTTPLNSLDWHGSRSCLLGILIGLRTTLVLGRQYSRSWSQSLSFVENCKHDDIWIVQNSLGSSCTRQSLLCQSEKLQSDFREAMKLYPGMISFI